jgi:hypothetical protein
MKMMRIKMIRKIVRKMEGGRPGCAVLFVLRSAGGYLLTHSSTIRELSTLFSSHSRTEDLVSSYRLQVAVVVVAAWLWSNEYQQPRKS